MERSVLGLDIGGANLKAAHTSGAARSQPFALWKNPGGLTDALRGLIAETPSADLLAVTMTGELCDCFESKREGVNAILDAVETAGGPMPLRVFCNDGQFVDSASARRIYLQVAAANWLALATFVGRFVPNEMALLIDVGSTTTDIVGLRNGRPYPEGYTDPQRLACGELVYTGVKRSPLCAVLANHWDYHAVAAELFATTLDAYLILGVIPENTADRNTADGRPATRAAAHARMARMLCADLETSSEEQRHQLALKTFDAQTARIHRAIHHVACRLPAAAADTVVLAGEGVFLARNSLNQERWFKSCREVDLQETLGRDISRAACAYAVAVLAAEE